MATATKELSLQEQLQVELAKNPLAWGLAYCPEHFRKPSPSFHLKIINASLLHRYFAVASPRESAKSTILTFLRSIHGIVFQLFRFIVIIQNTEQKAIESLNGIKMELRNNMGLRRYKVKITRDTKDDSVFKHTNGFMTRVLCKGLEQIGSIRGEKFGAYRPDLIIIDDLEDDTMVQNPELRNRLQEQFDQVIIPAGQQDICRYIVVGTLLHDDSQMAKLVSLLYYKEWRKLLFRARNLDKKTGQYFSLWPEVWSLEKLKKMEQTNPVVFAKEYQNDPVSGSLSRFRKEDWRYWYIEEGSFVLLDESGRVFSRGKLLDCKAAIAIDLAWEENRRADDSVIMPGYLTPNNDLLIDEYICEKGLRPDQLAEYLFTMDEKYKNITKKTVYIGFEKDKLAKMSKYLLGQEQRRRNKWLNFRDLQWEHDKTERIVLKLQPRYRQHTIFHRSGMGELEHQLMRIPSGRHDDLCFVAGTKISTLFGDKSIEDIKIGDFVITPNGFNKVIRSMDNGIKKVIDIIGLKGTPNHPVFHAYKGLVDLSYFCYNPSKVSRLSKGGLLKWKYQLLLHSMRKNTKEWVGKENITLVNLIPIKERKILKDFMWRFGYFIINGQFQKAIIFIIRMAILSITTYLIWNVYQLSNILRCQRSLIKKRILGIFVRLGNWLRYGISQKKEDRGMEFMGKKHGLISHIKNTNVNFVSKTFHPEAILHQNFVVTITGNNIPLNQESIPRKDNVLYVETSLRLQKDGSRQKDVHLNAELLLDTAVVYNITVDKAHLYYANGVLVGNCDAAQGLAQLLEYAPSKPKASRKEFIEDEKFRWLRQGVIDKNKKHSYVFGKKTTSLFGGLTVKTSWR